ncbi:MAG: S24 family peptidase [Pasteurellaceae bacterium]|nr:S24 family peptidase [Pasteurellaceae bacterium]
MKREIRQQRLRQLIEEISNGNVADFARKIDREPSYVSRMLYPADKAGAKPIGEKIVSDICSKLNLSMDWFDSLEDLPSELLEETIIIDVLNVEASAGSGSTGDLVEVVKKLHYVPEQFYTYFRGMNPDNIRVINVRGDSMQPTFNAGDMIFVDISTCYFDGDGVYVFNYKGDLFVKRLQNLGDRLLVLSDNSAYTNWDISEENYDQLYIQGKVKVHQSQKLNFIG